MRNFKPIKQARVSEEVFEQLKEAILTGDFKAGDKLPSERDLAEQFQVSRVAVREALRALENSGFVVTRQGAAGGAYVTDLTFEYLGNAFLDLFLANKISVPELHQVRIFIEPEVARLAALNVTEESGERLRRAFEAEAPSGAPLAESVAKGTEAHYILAEMCGNRFFEAIVNSLLKLNTKIVETAKPDPDVVHPSGMHRPIVEAVLAKDAEGAAEAMRKHAIEFGKNLIKMENEYRRKAGLVD
ncbi:MAG: FadR family transcriptional regulator [Desulfobacteraceae bacterium]|nr:FadR family transcriptional regulator [Desulfobacteraceae bacterium]